VHVDDDRQHAVGAARLDESDARVAHRRRHGDPLLVDREFLDGRGLDVVEDLARCGVVQLVEQRRLRGGVCDLLRGRLKNDPGRYGRHGLLLLHVVDEPCGQYPAPAAASRPGTP
jgi:hypothetical protein